MLYMQLRSCHDQRPHRPPWHEAPCRADGCIPDELFAYDRQESGLNKEQLKGEVAASYSSFEPLADLSLRADLQGGDAVAAFRGYLV